MSGEIIAADAGSLVFEIHTRDLRGNDHLRLLKLAGTWQADCRNRLVFTVSDNRESGVLLFRNSWMLDDGQAIVYEYEKRARMSRHRFRLEGHWLVSSAERITYALGKGNYGPEFSCQLESVSLRPKQGCVKFRVGSGVAYKRTGPVVTVYGSWRFSKKYAIDFSAGTNGRMELDLSRALRRVNGTAFLRMLRSGNDKRIEAGIKIPF